MRERIISFLLRLFILRRNPDPPAKGIIFIQVDGLSYDVLSAAMLKGYCPFLRRLIKRRGYRAVKYYCGPPAMTNAQLAMLMYGVRNRVPGFTWYDRRAKEFIRAEQGAKAVHVEKFLSEHGTPLFTGGSVIMSPYGAGAGMTNLSAPASWDRWKILLRLRIILLYFVHPIKALRIWTSVAFHTVLGIVRMTVKRSASAYVETIRDMLALVFLGEFVRFAAIMDIRRQTPKMFMNFVLYDEFAHSYGRTSRPALSALRLVDWCIESVFAVAKRVKTRYEIVIASDHGHSEAYYFNTTFGIPFAKFVEAVLWSNRKLSVVMYDMHKQDAQLREHDVVCVPCGGFVHLYFPKRSEAYTLPQLDAAHPGFVDRLLAHPGVGWVLARSGPRRQVLRGKNGSVVFGDGRIVRIDGTPFVGAPVTMRDLEAFAAYAGLDTLGDLVVYGAPIGGGVVGFENQASLHGGFFGDMMHPFLMTNDHDILAAIGHDDSAKSLYDAVRKIGGVPDPMP